MEIDTLIEKVKRNKFILWWKQLIVAPWISTMMKTWQTGVICNYSLIHLSHISSLILTMLSYPYVLAISFVSISIMLLHSLIAYIFTFILITLSYHYSIHLIFDPLVLITQWERWFLGLLTCLLLLDYTLSCYLNY